MPGVDAPYLGFDPGGSHCFGVALFDGHGVLLGTTSSVDEALAWAVDKCGTRTPTAAGIDTLLHWCTGPSGYRPCDRLLKQRYAAKSGSIMAPNSLYGAMAIGGMALALRLKQHWPDIVLNETHPKVLLHALGVPKYDPSDLKSVVRWLIGTMKSTDWSASDEHAFDAALSAWATREGLLQGWDDIVGPVGQQLFPAGPVRYLWPGSDPADQA